MSLSIQQPLVRNQGFTGIRVCSHTGEFFPIYTDLKIPGRGISFEFIRAYRSFFTDKIGLLGRGWIWNYSQRLEEENGYIIYHDGAGREFVFTFNGLGYDTPDGLYCVLTQAGNQYVLSHRHGLVETYEVPADGGRLLKVKDRTDNALRFSYSDKSIIVVDSLNRKLAITVTKEMITQLQDHANRVWGFRYDDNMCLVEVSQPATKDHPNGTSIRYAYDDKNRLKNITDPKGQNYLRNYYDDETGRVIVQEHGRGVYQISYEEMRVNAIGSAVLKTTTTLKNGGKIEQTHTDAGHEESRTIYVNRDALSAEDMAGAIGDFVPLTTESAYNRHGELTQRQYPAGNSETRSYNEKDANALMRGNLLEVTEHPTAGIGADQKTLKTKYKYEVRFQFNTAFTDAKGQVTSYEYDKRGNLIAINYPKVTIQPVTTAGERPDPVKKSLSEKFTYNLRGQILSKTNTDGSIEEYSYYPENDPIGKNGKSQLINQQNVAGGYLCRVVRDAKGEKLTTEYAYDPFGNVSETWDGKGSSAKSTYNAMGYPEKIVGRSPFNYEVNYRYDANYNLIEETKEVEHYDFDETADQTVLKRSVYRERSKYNELDNLVERRFVAGEKEIVESFIRDEDERLIRHIQPLGNITEYEYDERDCAILKRSGVGTESVATYGMTHTRNGLKRSFTDGNSVTVTFSYDGFHRYGGYTNPAETTRIHHLDANGNVAKVEIVGDLGLVDRNGAPLPERGGNLREISYFYDEWNRIFRTEQQWRDPLTQEPLGKSNWKGEPGKIVTVAEFANNGRLSGVWREEDNPITTRYDGAERITYIKDTTGEETFVEYDANDNVTKLIQLGAPGSGERTRIEIRNQYDALDRLVWQQVNEDAPIRIEYNLFNNVTKTVSETGLETRYLYDALGRQTGQSFYIEGEQGAQQKILRRNEYDDNYRLTTFTDATGNRTVYRYDSRNRVIGIVEPTGNALQYEYDANDRLVRAITPRRQEIKQEYDGQGRLTKRRLLSQGGTVEKIEQFHYDGLNRMVAAVTDDAALTYHYDSFSRLLEEQQSGMTVRYGYDAAGNMNSLTYPSGKRLLREFDTLRRITAVKESGGQTIASYSYHAENQLQKITLGGKLEANFAWNNRAYLDSIEYRRTDNNQLVDGCRYQYDAAGNIVHEIQLDAGPTKGDRYFYDNANRVVRAQFDVADVNDPNSAFEWETTCEHFPEGLWKRRAEYDGNRVLQKDSVGTLTPLNGYATFGNQSFEYDENGNVIFIGEYDPRSAPLSSRTLNYLGGRKNIVGNYWLYLYGEHNRLIKAVEYGPSGNIIQTVEYVYDAFSRLTKRVVTDAKGTVTEYRYVFDRGLLIEEYVNGQLSLVYVYGATGSIPVHLTKKELGQNDKGYLFTFNGRGYVTALNDIQTLNPFERFAIDPFASHTLLKEFNGISIPRLNRQQAAKDILSSVLSGGFGSRQSLMHDFQTGNAIGSGRHHNGNFGSFLNFQELLGPANDFNVNEFGRGPISGAQKAPPPRRVGGIDISLYASEAEQKKAQEIMDNTRRQAKNDLFAIGIAVVMGGWAGGPKASVGCLATLLKVTDTAKGNIESSLKQLKQLKAESERKEKEAKEKEAKEKEAKEKEAKEKEAKEKEAKEKEAKEKEAKKKVPHKYYNPDSEQNSDIRDFGFQYVARQLEKKLNSNKQPVNPNIGPQGPTVDADTIRSIQIARKIHGGCTPWDDDMAPLIPAITEKDIERALVKGGGCPLNPNVNPLIDISVTPPLGNPHGGGDAPQNGMALNGRQQRT